MKIALGQIAVTGDKSVNLAKIEGQVEAAARAGARLAVFPEASMFHFGSPADSLGAVAEPVDGPFGTRLRELAKGFGISLVAGMFEKVEDDPHRGYNTLLAVDERGELYGTYRKIHLYDALGFQESKRIAPGAGETLVFSCDGVRFGVLTCYDVRFPELYRHLAREGADVLMVPAAFTAFTGKDHWQVLLQARAIENTAYVLAPAQTGLHYGRRQTHGHALVIDPWGTVMADAGVEPGLAMAPVDMAHEARVRAQMPSLQHRHPALF